MSVKHGNAFIALQTIALLGPAVAYAEGSAFDEEIALQLTEAVVAEHRVYATCMSLDKTSLSIVEENWAREIKQAAERLQGEKPSADFVRRFSAAVEFDNLLDRSMTLATAIDLCHTHGRQIETFHELGFSRLVDAIEKATTRPVEKAQ